MKKLWILILMLATASTFAQDYSCPTTERAAFAESSIWCAQFAVGEACYGNSPVEIETPETIQFSLPGDSASLLEIDSIGTAVSSNLFGVVILQPAAYPLNAWTPQPIQIIAFGDTALTDEANERKQIQTALVPVISQQGANIRTGPSLDFRILTSLQVGDYVKVTGKLADETWLRVQLLDGQNGWLSATAVDAIPQDISSVNANAGEVDLLYLPFTDVQIRTQVDDARCSDAADSGVLIQTGAETRIRIRINQSQLNIAGTIFIQATDESTIVYVIEGQVDNGEETVTEGYQFQIQDGVATPAQIYGFARLVPLPLNLLSRDVYLGIVINTLLAPRPIPDRSPLEGMLASDPCRITTGPEGSNLRAGPGTGFPIRGVMAFRESSQPTARYTDSTGQTWWQLAPNVWVAGSTTVTGGDCIAVPILPLDQLPNLPEPTEAAP